MNAAVAAEIAYLNLGEFARVVGSTEPTVRKRIDEADDGEWLIERGGKGRDYRIDPVLGPQWWRAEEDRRRAEEEKRGQAVEQLALHFLGENALRSDLEGGLSPADQLKLLEVQKALRLEAKERGDLLDRRAIGGRLNQVMTLLTKRVLAAAKRAARDADMAHAQRAEWEEAVENALNEAIDQCQDLLRGEA